MKGLAIIVLFLSFGEQILAQVNLTNSDLPIMIIETNGIIEDEPKVSGTMKLIYTPGQRNYIIDPPNEYNGDIGIEKRGSTSQTVFPKTGFGFETRDEFGENLNVSLLGMPEENDWVLHGPYSDKTLMRNAIAYTLAGQIMEYSPRVRHVELILNGQYWGVYLLIEKIKRDKNRVDVKKNNDDITGGYIIKIDKYSGSEAGGWISQYAPLPGQNQFIEYQYHYPKESEINSNQAAYIESQFRKFENIMASDNFDDPIDGYKSVIDETTFMDFILVNEITKNPDAYRLSTFFYKNRDSIDHRIKMGPVWDFNLALGNVDYCVNGNPQGWAFDHNLVCPNDFWSIPFYWAKFRDDDTFNESIYDRWVELRADKYSDQSLISLVDSLKINLTESQARNFQRWPVLGQYVWPNYQVFNSYTEEVNRLKSWLIDRAHWMDQNLPIFNSSGFNSEDQYSPSIVQNPVRDILTLKFYADNTKQTNLRIFNMVGKLVFEEKQAFIAGDQILDIDVQDLSQGMYILEFKIVGEDKGDAIKFTKF